MEKRYLEGNARVAGYGTLKVVFDDIKNYEERKCVLCRVVWGI